MALTESTGPPQLPPEINFDAVLRELLGDMAQAADGWANGRPKDETALLNRITERLSRRRRKCDVGVTIPVAMTAEFYELHRRASGLADKYGSDFAVTIQVENPSPRRAILLKTAFFQLKLSTDEKLSLDSEQLRDSLSMHELKGRTFVLAVDEVRFVYRIRPALECFDAIKEGATKTFSSAGWEFLSQWLLGWFSCNRGLPSDPEDAKSPERLLDHFRIGHPEDFLAETERVNLPPNYAPAKSWLKYTFRPSQAAPRNEPETLL